MSFFGKLFHKVETSDAAHVAVATVLASPQGSTIVKAVNDANEAGGDGESKLASVLKVAIPAVVDLATSKGAQQADLQGAETLARAVIENVLLQSAPSILSAIVKAA